MDEIHIQKVVNNLKTKVNLYLISTNEMTYIKSQQRKIFNLKSMRRLYIENFYQFLTRCENILIKSSICSVLAKDSY